MVQPKPKNKALRWAAFGVLATMLVASMAPLATARHDERPERRERPQHPERDFREFTISLNGTATDRENNSYTIELDGGGRLRTHERGDNLSIARGVVRFDAKLYDANGTLVKEGSLKGRIHAHEVAEGEWKFYLVTVGHRGIPNLGLRGNATLVGEGVYDLEALGRAVLRLPDEDRRTVLKLDVSGQATKA